MIERRELSCLYLYTFHFCTLSRLLNKGLSPSFRAKRGISLRRKPKRREIPHSTDFVRDHRFASFLATCQTFFFLPLPERFIQHHRRGRRRIQTFHSRLP